MTKNNKLHISLLSSFYPWIIVCCGILFYCFNYFLRVSPSVMQSELTHAFHINAYQFGALAAFYYYAYTPMQIPAGMIYDKFGVRFVLCAACLIAVMGLATFINADNFYMAGLGRLMIGLGTAFSYIGALKLAAIWLPANRFATVAGMTTSLGMFSAVASQRYLTIALETVGYQQALKAALIAGIVLSVMILLIIRNRPRDVHKEGDAETQSPIDISQLFKAIRFIVTNKQMWLIGVIGCLLYLPASVFLDLWGIPYLKAVYKVTPAHAVQISSFTFYGWVIAGTFLGWLSDKIKRRRIILMVSGVSACTLLSMVFYFPGGINPDYLTTIFFLIGFSCGAHPLCFVLGKENNPLQIAGTSVALTNMLIMAGGAIFQPIVGKLLDMHSSGTLSADGLAVYSSADYTFALSVVPIGVAIGLFLSFFLTETYCKCIATEEEENLFKHPSELSPAMANFNEEPELATENKGSN